VKWMTTQTCVIPETVSARGRCLFTKGQQTLGVALPWAIAATLVRPAEKVISISGGGGKSPDDIVPVLKRAPTTPGPVIVGVHVEYSDDPKLFENVYQRRFTKPRFCKTRSFEYGFTS
jgi:thiamine pyrophosphate-dependent acetolactate synthase large subunit-like protein